MRATNRCFWALPLLLSIATPVLSQSKPPAAPPPVSPEPAQTTATYGNWTLRCEASQQADKVRRLCEVAQLLQPQNQTTPIAQVAFGRFDATNAVHVVAVLPVNVVFPSTARIGVDDKDQRPVELAWRRCLPGGCFAEAVASDEALNRWRAASEPGRLMFKDAANRDITISLPFRGLGQALDAMPKPQ